jgi:hypothetical protein
MGAMCAFCRSLCFNARNGVRHENSELHDRLVVLFDGLNELVREVHDQHICQSAYFLLEARVEDGAIILINAFSLNYPRSPSIG